MLESVLDIEPGSNETEAARPASTYGDWLTSTRTAVPLTRRELAAKSGVSEPQIWNIETGNTTNPRSTTRDRLESALGSTPPAEARQVIEDDAAIADVGTLTDFDPHDDADRPPEPGVYVFYDVSERPIYVGMSEDIRRRVRTHEDAFWFKRPIVDSAAFVAIDNKVLRRQVEATLIRFLKSNAVINRQHVDRA